ELSDEPELISEMLMKLLSFELPITKRQKTGQIVRAIRQIFTFSELPDIYFTEKLILLPGNLAELEDQWKKNFLMTELTELQHLSEYVQDLKSRYNFKRLPNSYFDLPEEKLLLLFPP
ncbi:21470_t:CDS:1, partial [Gigaspora rosea]